MTPLRGRWAAARRIAAVRLDGMDGVLMTTPALRALAAARPAVEVALITSPDGADIARLIPEVAEVLVDDARAMPGTSAEIRLADVLRRGRFDGAVLFDAEPELVLAAERACRSAGVPLVLGGAAPGLDVPDLTGVSASADAVPPHGVRRALDLVGTLGARIEDEHESVRVPPAAARWIRARLADEGVGRDRPWAALALECAESRPRLETLVETARSLVLDHGWRVVIAASANDATAAAAITAPLGQGDAVSLVGELDLAHRVALAAYAPVVVATGPAGGHVAAAVATPVVGLLGHAAAERAPWGVPSRVLPDTAEAADVVGATLELAAGVTALVRALPTASRVPVGVAAR